MYKIIKTIKLFIILIIYIFTIEFDFNTFWLHEEVSILFKSNRLIKETLMWTMWFHQISLIIVRHLIIFHCLRPLFQPPFHQLLQRFQ